jgi:hypothetical protein
VGTQRACGCSGSPARGGKGGKGGSGLAATGADTGEDAGAAAAPTGVRDSTGALVRGAYEEHAASVPRIRPWATTAKRDLMGWIVFEAMLALAVMLAVVWWTFRGRADDEPDEPDTDER